MRGKGRNCSDISNALRCDVVPGCADKQATAGFV